MKTTFVGLFAIGFTLVFCTGIASAQIPSHMEFTVDGTTNFTTSPVEFLGSITSGEALLVGGYWNLMVDDTGWPDDSNAQVRWDYIAATYYYPNYDGMSGNWTATFDENTTASVPTWGCGNGGVGSLTGTAALQLTIIDFNFDGVIDPDERAFNVFSGTLIVVKNGEGIFAGFCGLGSYSGSLSNPDPINFADDVFSGTTILDVEDCAVPVQEVTWGNVKAHYR
jgi:hypothetical protein